MLFGRRQSSAKQPHLIREGTPLQKHSAMWTKHFCYICLVCLFAGFAMNMLNSIMAKYIYTIYGNASFSGLLNGVFAAFAILARILAGNLSDKLGRQKILIFGCILFAVSILMFGIFPFPALLILSRGLQGFGYSTATTADYAAGSDILPEGRVNEGIGYIGLGYSIAMAIGPAMALAIVSAGNYPLVFYLASALCGLSIIFGLLLGETKQTTAVRSKICLKNILERNALPATIVQFFNCFAFAAVNSFIVLFADHRGFENISLFFTFTAIGMCVSRFFSGRLADHFGPRTIGIPALLLNTCCFLLLLFANHIGTFYFAGILFGFGTGTTNPLFQTLAVCSAPPDRRGAANGTYQIANDLANGVGALFWGIIIDLFGYHAVFLCCAFLTIVSAFCLYKITDK